MDINKQYEKIGKVLKQNGIEPDFIDISLLDKTLDYHEQLDNVANMLNLQIPPTKMDDKNNKEIAEDYNREQLKKEKTEYVAKQTRLLKKMRKQPSNLDKYFEKIGYYIQAVEHSKKIHGMLLFGSPACGKSHFIRKQFPNSVYLQGRITGIELYGILLRNKNSVIIIDDYSDLLRDSQCYTLLLQATETNKNRTIMWNSRAIDKDEELTRISDFNGKIVLISNRLDKRTEALQSRCYVREIRMSYFEKLQIMQDYIIQEKYPIEIFEFIQKNTTEAHTNILDLRLVDKINEFYRSCNAVWQPMSMELLCVSEERILVYELEQETSSVKEKVRKFKEATGMSERQYYYIKNEFATAKLQCFRGDEYEIGRSKTDS